MSGDPGLLYIDPEPGGIDDWTFTHNQDHNRLLNAVLTQFPTAKFDYRILDPLPRDIEIWLLDHQRAHDDLASVTGVIQNDLLTVDFKDPAQRQAWIELNQTEHAAFSTALGI